MPAQPLSTRLSQWLGWTHAVALSATLDDRSPTPTGTPAGDPADLPLDVGECARARSVLAATIVGDRAFSLPGPGMSGGAAPDFSFFRQRHVALQQVMEADTSHLRGRLRGLLARQAPHLSQLAAMDAVMERVLARQERALLTTLPDWLGQHFDRLQQAAVDAAPPHLSPAHWLDGFRADMRNLLLAELDLRLQPSEGLVAALRTTVTS